MRCASSLVALLACSGCYGPIDVEWSASFQNASDSAEADYVFVDVRQDTGILDCPGELEDLVRGPYQIRPAAPAGTIPTLDAGEYCFHATAVRADCTWVAAGWIALEIPRDEVSIVMRSMTGGGCSAGQVCVAGQCVSDGVTRCAAGTAYCGDAMLCCPGADEGDACDFFELVGSGCTAPL